MRQVDGEKGVCDTWGDLFTCHRLVSSRDGIKGEQKSAEGIVAIPHDGEGPNVMSGLRT
jgi:hypothetical protein